MNNVDRIICEIDAGLRTLFAAPHAQRPLPPLAAPRSNQTDNIALPAVSVLTDEAKRESARLMRINHAGEVCAQALYQGQAAVARSVQTRTMLQHAAQEERDHLAWCQTRLNELNGNTSRLTPFFYVGSFALGAMSGLLGDKWSMGFLVETERQVETHLGEHLNQLASQDQRSCEILEAMRADEIHHAESGLAHGGVELPAPAKAMMRGISKVMTTTTYWI